MPPSSAAPAPRLGIATLLARFDRLSLRVVGGVALLVAAFALGLALAAEYWGGLLPCSLCLLERWPYRVVILLGAVAMLSPPALGRALLWLIVVVMAANAGLAIVHVGVEQHWWLNPITECAAPQSRGGSAMELFLQLSSHPPMPCDRATYLIPFVPLSMAAMNALFAAGFAALVALYLWRSAPRRPGRPTAQP
jgi:disulfide bond formation protein DsbB